MLYNAGLGLKKIKLSLTDNEQDVYNKITSSDVDEDNRSIGFPQLIDCGGFELMTCFANSRDLNLLSTSLAAKDLKSKFGGSQCKIYIRPIQRNLSTKSLAKENTCMIKEKWKKCGEEFLLRDLRKHINTKCRKDEVQLFDEIFSFNNYSSSDSQVDDEELDNILIQPVFASQQPQQEQQIEPVTLDDDDERTSTPQSELVVSADNLNGERNPTLSPQVEPVSVNNDNNEQIEDINVSPEPILIPDDNIVLDVTSQETEADIHSKIEATIAEMKSSGVDQNPVECLRMLQKNLVWGRKLEITDLTADNSGATNFIMVDRGNLLETGFEELKSLNNKFLTLEVQFYGEVCHSLYMSGNKSSCKQCFSAQI